MPSDVPYVIDRRPESHFELHRLARSGDAGAMCDAVRSYAWWVRSRRVPWCVDPWDAESAAWEGVWRGVLACEAPEDVPKFAGVVYRNLVCNATDAARRRRELHHVEWHRMIGGFVFPCDLAGLAAACVDCGTLGGYAPPRCSRPCRSNGRCRSCDGKHLARRRPCGSPITVGP